MSSINSHFTMSYSQPEEYRFSHDSVFLARRVFERMTPEQVQVQKILDLCSGCGIVGLDYLFHCKNELHTNPLSADFMEIQEVYRPHFEKNVATLASPTQCQLVVENYSVLMEERFHQKYELILSNPPYFRVGHGKLSPSEFKNRCRFFIDSDFAVLIRGIENALTSGGQAYVLLRDDKDHGYSPIQEARKLLSSRTRLEILEDIRGTGLVLIQK